MTKPPKRTLVKTATKNIQKRNLTASVNLMANIESITAAGNGKHRVPTIMPDGTVKYCALQPGGTLDLDDCIS